MTGRKNDPGEYRCPSCLDHGFRVFTDDGRSFNALAAKANGIAGERRPCPSCGGQQKITPKEAKHSRAAL
jgi:hypothetical protein